MIALSVHRAPSPHISSTPSATQWSREINGGGESSQGPTPPSPQPPAPQPRQLGQAGGGASAGWRVTVAITAVSPERRPEVILPVPILPQKSLPQL